MKKTISLFALLFIFQLFTNAQCDINEDELIKTYVKEGIVLMHESYNNKNDKPYKVVFNIGVTYGVFLLNPSKELPKFTLLDDKTGEEVNCSVETNEKDNYAYYKFTIKKSGQYKVVLDFDTEKKECVLFVLTFIKKA